MYAYGMHYNTDRRGTRSSLDGFDPRTSCMNDHGRGFNAFTSSVTGVITLTATVPCGFRRMGPCARAVSRCDTSLGQTKRSEIYRRHCVMTSVISAICTSAESHLRRGEQRKIGRHS